MQDSQPAPSSRLCSRQREEAGPGPGAGSEPQGSAVAGSGDRLRLPRASRRARQPCPGRQGLKPHLFIAAAQPGPAASNHLLPLCSWPLVQLSAAAPPDRSSHSLRPDSSQQDLAGSLPACLLPCARSALPAARPPAVPRCGDPQASGCAPEAPLCWSSLPAQLKPRAAPVGRSWRRCRLDGM